MSTEQVNHPDHYGGGDNPYEAIKVIEAWELDFPLGAALKYIRRTGKKDHSKLVEDLQKALWYVRYRVQHPRNTRPARWYSAVYDPERVVRAWNLLESLLADAVRGLARHDLEKVERALQAEIRRLEGGAE